MGWQALVGILAALLQAVHCQNKPVFVDISDITKKLGSTINGVKYTGIPEDTETGTIIGRVSAIDPEGGDIEYGLDLGAAGGVLEIDINTGEITLKSALDYEAFTSLGITVTAKSTQTTLVENFQSVLFIADANDLLPEFQETVFRFQLFENQTTGYVVTTMRVSDNDTVNNRFSVKCEGTDARGRLACQYFQPVIIEATNLGYVGNLVLQRPLDYEENINFNVPLVASDGKNRKEQTIFIDIIDINDSPPRFIRAQENVINENIPIGTYIDWVYAEDTDEQARRPIAYKLIGDADALKYFTVDKDLGNITTINTIDYEDPDRRPNGKPWTLTILAQEVLQRVPGGEDVLGNDPQTSVAANVTIRVRDLNDNCPVFNQGVYEVFVKEDILELSNLELTLSVSDADSGGLSTFKLSLESFSNVFEVRPTVSTGSVAASLLVIDASAIDYESAQRTFDVRVRATQDIDPQFDDQNLVCTSTALVRVTVQDANDQAPKFPISYNASVLETAGKGTFVIQVEADDSDTNFFGKNGLVYSLASNEFVIDKDTGRVTVAECTGGVPGNAPCIDYEKRQTYDLTVRVQDNKGQDPSLPGSATLIINVIDVNDNKPNFPDNYFRTIDEGRNRTNDPLFVQAIDVDRNDVVTYSIPANQPDAALWQINSTTGEITATRNIRTEDLPDPNRETFIFDVEATDGLNPVTARVTIRVIDKNDKQPIFLPANYRIAIPENIPGGSFIIQVSVRDLDSPSSDNGQVDVSVDSGGFGKFVTSPSGLLGDVLLTNISTAPGAVFDYDNEKQYILIVEGRDRGTPSLTGTATVTVDILDINNKNPYFDPPSQSVTVRENEPPGSYVTTVSAKDLDADKDLRISFGTDIKAYQNGAEVTDRSIFQNMFAIDQNGRVTVNSPLDRDIVSFMTFQLRVQDVRVNPPQEGTGSLFIRILEYNDQAPQFRFPVYNVSVEEGTPIGSRIITLVATDEDDQIASYQLSSNPGEYFTIRLTSGELRVNRDLDYESLKRVTLQAIAFDNGSPELSNTTMVYVTIININDETPVFTKNVYSINILEHTDQPNSVITVSATDKDEEDFGVVRYSLNDTYFTIDNITGDIFLKPGANLDREISSTYTFTVVAYDSPNHPDVRRQVSIPVFVVLGDINDNCPVFSLLGNRVSQVIETADKDDQVLELFAEDADSRENQMIKFTIDPASASPPEAFTYFDVQSISSLTGGIQSGRIKVRSSLRNQAGVYNFTVVASDLNGDSSKGTVCSTRTNVSIVVREAINDAPEWVRPPSANTTLWVLESQYRGMFVYDCRARDRNTGDSGKIDYSFNVGQQLQQTTAEFRINQVTCIIRAQIVFDREQVDTYALTLVAKDRGDPAASSETVLVIKILDVNDNDPEFPMRDGETIPITMSVREGVTPNQALVIGTVEATDKDSDHKNNEIFYRILAGNDEGYFILDRETGAVSLNPAKVGSGGLDREEKATYSMDILAYNDVNDDTVIRERRKRSTNPSIVTVVIEVEDSNDTPPRFTQSKFYGCVSLDARFGQSIVTVEAEDQDVVRAQVIQFSKVSESVSGDFFSVDRDRGVVRNQKLLTGISSRQPVVRVRADDNPDQATERGPTSETDVQIFVTDTSNEIILEVSQPSSDVRFYQEELKRVMVNSSLAPNPITFVCVRDIRDHMEDDGSRSFTSSDVYLSAVGQDRDTGNYFIYSGERLKEAVNQQLNNEATRRNYQTIYIKNIETQSDEDSLSLTEEPVLVIFIIAILLIFLAILLFILACCLIRNSKKKKIKKLRAERNTHVEVVRHEPPVAVSSVNPVYDNKGYQGEDEYAVVQKRPVAPVVVPVTVPDLDDTPPAAAQPRVYEEELYPPQDDQPEPVIITEPIMSEEPMSEMVAPPPANFFDPEPRIETEVTPEEEEPFPAVIESDPEDAIDVEIRDEPNDSPRVSPRYSPQPSPRTSPDRSPPDSPRRSPPDSPRRSPPDSPRRSPPDSPHRSPPDSPRPSPPESQRSSTRRSPSPDFPMPPPDEEYRIETDLQ